MLHVRDVEHKHFHRDTTLWSLSYRMHGERERERERYGWRVRVRERKRGKEGEGAREQTPQVINQSVLPAISILDLFYSTPLHY